MTTPSGTWATQRVHVKFRDGTTIRLRNGGLVSLGSEDVWELTSTLSRYPVLQIGRLFDRPEDELSEEKANAEARTGQPQPDLNLWFRILLPSEADADGLIRDLQQLDLVETTYVEPAPAPPPNSHDQPSISPPPLP
jgi:hypothetical protein